MLKHCLVIFSFILVALLPNSVISQPLAAAAEIGYPFIQTYKPSLYNAAPSNYDIARDDKEIMYFANDRGVLIFDGVSWQLFSLPNQGTVRALCYANNRMFVGGQDAMGYLTSSDKGTLRYVSLSNHIPEQFRDFKNIWEIKALKDTVYFRSYFYLYRWSKGKMKVFRAKNFFHTIYTVGRQLWYRAVGAGLFRVKSDSVLFIPGSEIFAKESIGDIFKMGNNNWLIIARKKGIFQYDGSRFRKISSKNTDMFLSKALAFRAIRLNNNRIAIATQRKGLAILDNKGKIVRIIGKEAGLPDNTLLNLHKDAQGGLWIALSNGIARVDISPLFSFYPPRSGIEGNINTLIRHKTNVYAATRMGVFRLDTSAYRLPRFTKIPGINSYTLDLLSMPNRLLVGSHLGVFEIVNGSARKLVDLTGVTCLHQPVSTPNLVFAGHYQGIGILNLNADPAHRFTAIDSIRDQIINMADDKGYLWAGTRHGLIRFPLFLEKTTGSSLLPRRIERFGQNDGLPDGSVRIIRFGDQLLFSTQKGIFSFSESSGRFNRADNLPYPLNDTSVTVTELFPAPGGASFWLIGHKGPRMLYGRLQYRKNNSWQWEAFLQQRLEDIGDVYAILPEKNVVWFGGFEGLLRFNPGSVSGVSTDSFSVYIRRLRSLKPDSLILENFGLQESATTSSNLFRIPYAMNALRFEFAAAWYDQPAKNVYRVRLSGYDEDFTSWSAETFKDYTRLSPGNYTFTVQARNQYGAIAQPAHLSFRIVPPLYFTWWAYILYTAIFIVFLVFITKIRLHRLEKRTNYLEELVDQRTAMVRSQAKKLKELDILKSRFFANISHEFRTPLTLILGPLNDMVSEEADNTKRKKLERMHRNAKRMQKLINQLLDLSRLEHNKMPLNVQQKPLAPFLRGLLSSFHSLAEQKNIRLLFTDKSSNPQQSVYYDPDVLEKVITNLLSNALKFSPSGGRVELVLENDAQWHIIRVTDTGIGITAENLPHIFDRFYQITNNRDGSTNEAREYEGTGIGLALARELIELHHGEIEVRSVKGKGTEFIVKIPFDSAIYHRHEIAENAEEGQAYPPDIPHKQTDRSPFEKPRLSPDNGNNDPLLLLIEDQRDMSEYVREVLPSSYQIHNASDGEEGLKKALNLIPDLIISDVMMPGMDGFDLCRRLKSDHRTSHIPIILLTAKAGEKGKVTGLDTGADAYLTKPFHSEELRIRVQRLIEQRRKLQERFRSEGRLMPREIKVNSAETEFIDKLTQTLEKNLHNEHFGVEELSRAMHLSRRQMLRKISALSGQNPTKFIRSFRIQRAKELLQQGFGTISEVAYQVGYGNVSYFTRCFREETGQTPSQFIKNQSQTDPADHNG
ncbi:MAG TPA: hybrid sensor histidine kinase/response regulator [Caldithrix abyssi]|uniref:histidine kinase n=1 Tax=Caldithrix abyssi TaxID=187145 RepID=A0A7V4U2H9_CALAY|nr:hybrid sensor histidine kinase/response regulator [Caldithrix abyssi]